MSSPDGAAETQTGTGPEALLCGAIQRSRWGCLEPVLRGILRVHPDPEGESTADVLGTQEQEWWVTCHVALPDSAAHLGLCARQSDGPPKTSTS